MNDIFDMIGNAPSNEDSPPATTKQIGFIRKLLRELNESEPKGITELTVAQASEYIEMLLDMKQGGAQRDVQWRDNKPQKATQKQICFIQKLLEETGIHNNADFDNIEDLTKAQASEYIQQLIDLKESRDPLYPELDPSDLGKGSW